MTSHPDEEWLVRRGGRLLGPGTPPAGVPIVHVGDAAALDAALRQASGVVVAIEWAGDRMIPLENALATRPAGLAVWVYARGPREAPGALGALEHGADRVFVSVHSPDEVDELESMVESVAPGPLDWVLAPVASVRPAGIGDRVLVDTTSLLAPDEGLLVGSAAAFLFHVASEAVGSAFSRARPFRVNAGAAHSYVLMADGTTRYLSELAPEDAVLASRPRGPSRAVRVGRIKIERRPLVVIRATDERRERTVFLQEAETVRLSTENGRVAMTEIVAGAQALAVRLPPARHLGTAVEETIEER